MYKCRLRLDAGCDPCQTGASMPHMTVYKGTSSADCRDLPGNRNVPLGKLSVLINNSLASVAGVLLVWPWNREKKDGVKQMKRRDPPLY